MVNINRKMTPESSVKYEQMGIDDGYIDKQLGSSVTVATSRPTMRHFLNKFKRRPQKIPWKSISMAVVLCVLGTVLLIFGALLVAGKLDSKHNEKLWPIMILGVILFVPGFYHVRIAVYAYSGFEGYSYEDIPDYDD